MITDQDIEKLKTIFATKEELSELKIEVILQRKSLEQTIDKNTHLIVKQIIECIGEVIGVPKREIKENSSRIKLLEKESNSLKPYKSMIDDHEARIIKVENALDI